MAGRRFAGRKRVRFAGGRSRGIRAGVLSASCTAGVGEPGGMGGSAAGAGASAPAGADDHAPQAGAAGLAGPIPVAPSGAAGLAPAGPAGVTTGMGAVGISWCAAAAPV
jgi:hypothetical protein